MDSLAFIQRFGGNPDRYGVGKTTGGGAPTPRPNVTEMTPTRPVPITTEPGYTGASATVTDSRDSMPV